MRDPERIQPFLEKLGTIWKEKCPDWRFSQFLINILPYMQTRVRDIWYIEEDEFLELVDKYFNLQE